MTLAVNVVGAVGAVSLLAAFALLERAVLRAGSGPYVALNLLGSAGLAMASAAVHAWPSVALNVFWLCVGIATLARPPVRVHEPASKGPSS